MKYYAYEKNGKIILHYFWSTNNKITKHKKL